MTKLPLHWRLSQQISDNKIAEDLSAGSLILTCKIIFPQCGMSKKIMSDVSGNFISDKLMQFSQTYWHMVIATSSSYHLQIDRNVEVYKIHKAYCKMY